MNEIGQFGQRISQEFTKRRTRIQEAQPAKEIVASGPESVPETLDPFQRELNSHKKFLDWLSSNEEARYEWSYAREKYDSAVGLLGYSCEREFITMIAADFRDRRDRQVRFTDHEFFIDQPPWLLKEIASRRKSLWKAIRERRRDLNALDLGRFTNRELVAILEGEKVTPVRCLEPLI